MQIFESEKMMFLAIFMRKKPIKPLWAAVAFGHNGQNKKKRRIQSAWKRRKSGGIAFGHNEQKKTEGGIRLQYEEGSSE